MVTGQEDGKRMLDALERGNLFVIPLDDKRHWFRYHHLFSDVLHAHLMEEQPDQVPTLHQRACDWYEHNGSSADTIRHALAAEDFNRAAGLVELAWPAMDLSFQAATWLGWAKVLPDELVRARPVLSVGYAWALLNDGELEAGEARLQDAEQYLDTTSDLSEKPEASSVNMVVVDEEQFRSLPASIALARAYIAQSVSDISVTLKYARRALDLLSEEDHLQRGVAESLLGLTYWTSGDLESAHRSFANFMANMRSAGNFSFAISPTFVMADIRMVQGRLHEAIRTYEQSLQLATEQGEPVIRGNAALPDWPYRLCITQALIQEAQGDRDRALDLLDEGERLYYRTPIPRIRPIAALKTRVWVRQGRVTKAFGWVHERGLSVDDDLSYLHEFEHVTLARVLIANYKNDRVERSIHEAMGLLERLLKAAEAGGRMGSVIEILVLQALAHEAQGNISQALVLLERTLTLAEPEGYVRIFVGEGKPMAKLLSEAAAQGIMSDYVIKLLDVFRAEEQKQ
jgi:LuxR family maltose regulon positive regulatory protein